MLIRPSETKNKDKKEMVDDRVGDVVAGMDVVDKIGNVAVGDNGPMPGQAPVTPIPIKRIAVIKESP